MSNKMYDSITGRSPIATDDLGYIGTGQKASQILSGGTTDYDDLTNKPSINSVELSGNLTSSDLGLQSELNEAQTNAVNSGITAALTEQITTNQNNILTLENNYIMSVVTNAPVNFEPILYDHYLIIAQQTTTSSIYCLYYNGTDVYISPIFSTYTGLTVAASEGVVTITPSGFAVITVIRVGTHE